MCNSSLSEFVLIVIASEILRLIFSGPILTAKNYQVSECTMLFIRSIGFLQKKKTWR